MCDWISKLVEDAGRYLALGVEKNYIHDLHINGVISSVELLEMIKDADDRYKKEQLC